MQSDHLQKIQNSIKAAGILSPAEKAEWLELMDLMNDRQLFELERILLDVGKNQEAKPPVFAAPVAKQAMPSPASSLIPKLIPPTRALPPVPRPPKPSGFQTPTFSHILNLPKASGFSTGPVTRPNLTPQTRVESKTVEQKKPSPFLARLKAMFAEKELPPGTMAELPSPLKFSPANSKPPLKQNLGKAAVIANAEKIPPAPAKPQPAPIHHPELKKPSAAKVHPPHGKPIPPAVKPAAPPAKPENVTINVFVNSEEQRGKIAGFAKAESGLAQAAAGRAAPAQTSDQVQVAAPPPVTPKKTGSAPASQPTVVTGPPPAVIRNYNIIPPSEIVLPAAQFRSRETFYAAQARAGQVGQVSGGGMEREKTESGLSGPAKEAATAAGFVAGAGSLSPGLNFPEGSSAEALKARFGGGPGRTGPDKTPAAALDKIVLQEKPGDDMSLETLPDIDRLKPDDLRQHATGTMFRKFQKLIGQYGQHEVIFHLEKSPLYKAYIDTGVSWLKDDAAAKTATAAQLATADFERFADLLIIMRSKS